MPVRYLSATDVTAAMPPLADRLVLAERTMTALTGDAELPAKIGVHPRPPDSFAHAMPAALVPRDDPSGGADLLGIKWVTGVPGDRGGGLPAIHAIVIVSDPATGAPRAILDGGPITAERTAAVSGVAIARVGPTRLERPPRAVIIGAGVQGHSHLAVLGHVLPGVELAISDRHPERAEGLASIAARTPGIATARSVADPRAATVDADVVVTAASFTEPERRQVMDDSWVGPDALVVPVDYDTMCAASLVREAALFLVDERGQFLSNREGGAFVGYPDPMATIGEAIVAGTTRPTVGRVVISHLGVGLADVVFADAIIRRAEAAGLGTILPG